MKSEPSVAEIEIKEQIKSMEVSIESTLITVSEAEKLLDAAYKVLYKCEELRKSRDNWVKKYYKIKKLAES